MNEVFLAAYQNRQGSIERELIRRLEVLCDRVPTNEEVMQNLSRAVFPDGHEEFKWRGEMLMVVSAIEWTGPGNLP